MLDFAITRITVLFIEYIWNDTPKTRWDIQLSYTKYIVPDITLNRVWFLHGVNDYIFIVAGVMRYTASFMWLYDFIISIIHAWHEEYIKLNMVWAKLDTLSYDWSDLWHFTI